MSDGTGLTEPVLFRRIFQGLYGLIVLGFVTSIAVSGTYGAFFAPTPVAEEQSTEPQGDCRVGLADLFADLETEGQSLMALAHEPTSEARWKAFSDRFRGRLESIRTRCGLDTPEHAELARLADHLERHRLGYETALRSLRQIAGPSRAQLVESFGSSGQPGEAAPRD